MTPARILQLTLFLTLLGPVAPLSASGQAANPEPARAAEAQKTPGNDSFITPHTASTQNLAKAEHEDEEYVFRHSSSVRAIGKLFHLSPEVASGAFWMLNFLILALAVGYFVVKGLPAVFRNRRSLIEKRLVEARAATEDANRRLRAVEDRLSKLDGEIAAIREGAERDSAEDEARIKATIEDERRKILSSAESEIAAAGAAAERQLRHYGAELAIARARARLHLSTEDDRALIREFGVSMATESRNGGRG